ncbi:MAG: sulfatase-like hydrolase/transferase [Bacteroides cellulosilyticus]
MLIGTIYNNSHNAQSPNIIFILADDLGYGDISAFNPESKISTPNIDNLTQDGITFTDAHLVLRFGQHLHDIPFSLEDIHGALN